MTGFAKTQHRLAKAEIQLTLHESHTLALHINDKSTYSSDGIIFVILLIDGSYNYSGPLWGIQCHLRALTYKVTLCVKMLSMIMTDMAR